MRRHRIWNRGTSVYEPVDAARRPVALRPVALRLDARGQASLQQPWKIHDTIAIPTRGILMGTLLSSCLWAALIVAGRALWLYLR